MSNVLTTQEILDQAFGTNTVPQAEVNQALDNNSQKPTKAIGVQISAITVTKHDSSLYLGSAFNIDVGFLEPLNYDKGIPPQNGDSLKSQIFNLSIRRQHEEYTLMREIADEMLANKERERTVEWDKIDAQRFPFTVAMWSNSSMTWHFINRKVDKPSASKISADDVVSILSQIL